MWKTGCLDYRELPNILPKNVKAHYFAEKTEIFNSHGDLMVIKVVNWDDQGCPKIRDFVDPKAGRDT